MRAMLCALGLGMAAAARVAAAQQPGERALLIDLAADPILAVSVSADDLTCSPAGAATTREQNSYKAQLDEACREGGSGDIDTLREKAACFRPRSSSRWVSNHNDLLHVYVFYRGEAPLVTRHEDPRRTRLATDLSTLLKLAAAIGTKNEAGGGQPVTECRRVTFALENERASLKITATQSVLPADPAVAPPAFTGSEVGAVPTKESPKPTESPKTKEQKAEFVLTTGPKEHWFLAAEVPVKRMNELKFDQASGMLATKQTPAQFYVSLDYTAGDLLRDAAMPHSVWSDVVLKALFRASKKPFESFGFGLGLRGKYGLNFDTVSPFVAYLATRTDPAEAGTIAAHKLTTTFQFGVSFNLDQALAWVKGDAK